MACGLRCPRPRRPRFRHLSLSCDRPQFRRPCAQLRHRRRLSQLLVFQLQCAHALAQEDFQYNLRLLEERDRELESLDLKVAQQRDALRSRDSVINQLLAVGLYQLGETRIPDHAVVSQTVEAARTLRRPKLAPLVNAILRRALRDRIFDPFVTTKDHGTGLGLATAYRVVNEHGGRLTYDTRLGRGTTFLMDLPAAAHSDNNEGSETAVPPTI